MKESEGGEWKREKIEMFPIMNLLRADILNLLYKLHRSMKDNEFNVNISIKMIEIVKHRNISY